MSLDFGKLDFAVSFKRLTAFPLDAVSYFESLADAQAAAAGAKPAGSAESVHYFGEWVCVVENNVASTYQIQPDGTLSGIGGGIEIDTTLFEIDKNGKLVLKDFIDAVAGTSLVKKEDGSIAWVKLASAEDLAKATKDIEDINSAFGSYYTKEEINTKLADVGMKRVIVDSVDDIDVNKEDAERYIYMAPSGLQDDDNKYYEYVVIDGVVEQVGSWEVDLSAYAKTTDVNEALKKKVDVVYYAVEKEDGTTEQIPGALLSPEDKEKLAALVIDDDGSIGISGTVNASNVEGLGTWITENAINYIVNLTEDNLSADLKNKINKPDFITSIDETNFTVVDGKLDFKQIPAAEVSGLQALLDSKVNVEEGSRLIKADEIALLERVESGEFKNFIGGVDTNVFAVNNEILSLTAIPSKLLLNTVGDLTTLTNFTENTTLVKEINNIYEILAWQSMDELAGLITN